MFTSCVTNSISGDSPVASYKNRNLFLCPLVGKQHLEKFEKSWWFWNFILFEFTFCHKASLNFLYIYHNQHFPSNGRPCNSINSGFFLRSKPLLPEKAINADETPKFKLVSFLSLLMQFFFRKVFSQYLFNSHIISCLLCVKFFIGWKLFSELEISGLKLTILINY